MEATKLIEALRPFAMQADTMWTLADKEKVCGIEVRHFRMALRLVRKHDLAERGHVEKD